MLASSRKSAFTLLETLISAALLIVVLSASVVANRVISSSAQVSSESSQMASLADEAISNVQLLKDSLPAGQDLGYYYLNLQSQQPKDQTVQGIFAASTAPLGSNCKQYDGTGSSINCSSVENGGPFRLTWCVPFGLCDTSSFISPVGIDGSGSSNCGDPSTNCLISGLIYRSSPAELVAIRRQPCTTCSDTRNFLSAANQKTDPVPSKPVAFTSDTDNWDFYWRNITITRLGTCKDGTSDGGSCTSFDPSNDNAILHNHTYQVTVTITNYHNPQSTLTKTITLTDPNLTFSWAQTSSGSSMTGSITGLAATSQYLYASTDTGEIWSTSDGQSWTKTTTIPAITSLSTRDDYVYAGTRTSPTLLYKSSGINPHTPSSAFDSTILSSDPNAEFISTIFNAATDIFAGTETKSCPNQLFQAGGGAWPQILRSVFAPGNNGCGFESELNEIVSAGTDLLTGGTDNLYIGGYANNHTGGNNNHSSAHVLYYNGSSWNFLTDPNISNIGSNNNGIYVSSLTIYNNILYAGFGNYDLSNSAYGVNYNIPAGQSITNVLSYDGSAWSSPGGTSEPNFARGNQGDRSITSMISFNNQLFVGTANSNGAHIYTYDGTSNSWNPTPFTSSSSKAIIQMAAFKGTLYAGTKETNGTGQVICYCGH